MFQAVAPAYDKTNTVLSAGIHHLWRKKLVRLSGVKEGDKILDCATGTGDLALEFKKAVGERGEVTGSDFCPEMLAFAPKKAREQKLEVKFEVADVTQLPYGSHAFDVASIAFGIRNVSDVAMALRELSRVLKPGGRLMILEFGQPTLPGLKQAFEFYSKVVLPKIGGWVSGQHEAYNYLQKSSSVFPSGNTFVELMDEHAGTQDNKCYQLMGGIAYIYRGIKT
jgi:demethylmenaquinone methyltransferase/2-methoxy-6-polyprenyl-1,4-benzoquinol methylase